jgi:uncharacterized DUF497 family protein
MTFEWDAFKAITNFRKHGISFEQSVTAFDDEHHFITYDRDHSVQSEERFQLLGYTKEPNARIVVIVFTVKEPDSVHRIISARPANRRERRIYEQST